MDGRLRGLWERAWFALLALTPTAAIANPAITMAFDGLTAPVVAASENIADATVRNGHALSAIPQYEDVLAVSSDLTTKVRVGRKLAEIDLHALPPKSRRPHLIAALKWADGLPRTDVERVRLDTVAYRSASIDGDNEAIARFAAELRNARSDGAQISAQAANYIDCLLLFYESPSLRDEDAAVKLLALAERQVARDGQGSVDAYTTIFRAGWKFAAAGNFTRALELFEQAAAGREAALGPKHFETLFAKSAIVDMRINLKKGVVELPNALSLADELKTSLGVNNLDTLHEIGRAYILAFGVGDQSQVLRLGEIGYVAARELLGSTDPTTKTFATAYCNAVAHRGQQVPLAAYEECARQWTRDFRDFSDPSQVDIVMELGRRYNTANRDADALRMGELCAAHVRTVFGPADPRTLLCLFELGTFQLGINDLKGARANFQDVAIFAPQAGAKAAVLGLQAELSLAFVEMGEGVHTVAALDHLDRALELEARILPVAPASDRKSLEDNFAVAKGVIDEICRLDDSGNDCRRAKRTEQSISLIVGRAPVLPEETQYESFMTDLTSAIDYISNSKFEEAKSIIGREYNRLSLLGATEGSYWYYFALADLDLLSTGIEVSQKSPEFPKYIKRFEEDAARARLSSGLSDDQRTKSFAPFSVFYRMLAGIVANSNVSEAFRLLESGKARIMGDKIAQDLALQTDLARGADAAELRGAWRRLQDNESKRSHLAPDADEGQRAEAAAELTSARQAFEAAQTAAIARSPRLAELLKPPSVTVERLQRSLGPDDVWVSFLVAPTNPLEIFGAISDENAPRTVGIFIIDRSHIDVVDIGKVDRLEFLVRALRVRLSAPERREGRLPDDIVRGLRSVGAENLTRDELIAELSKAVLEPIAKKLHGRRLIISPDGPLTQLPFEVLRLNGHYLVENYDVSLTPSAGVWLLQHDRALQAGVDNREVYAFGEARYQDRTTSVVVHPNAPPITSYWHDLPGTGREIDGIASAVPTLHSYRGAQASEAQLAALNESGALMHAKIIHFAAHGFYDLGDPFRSGIVLDLVGADRKYDGVVTAAKLLRYDLRSNLIVLSACDTGLGRIDMGEGVLGLSWALAVAGNRDLISSLWSVDDEATADMMIRLYRGLAHGLEPSAALAAAKREMLTTSAHADPYYWAPFVVQGY